MPTYPGIEPRKGTDGRMHYRVRVSRRGQSFTATLPTLEAALAWRAQGLAEYEGSAEPPAAIVERCAADDARLERSFAGPLYALAFGAGLRLGVLLALCWGPDGLDLEAGVVHVRASLDRVCDASGEYSRLAPKSRAG